tara:strand:+ start:488 stop:1102 length:615 start_codon:yes stop_codon:yes gene_type:complete
MALVKHNNNSISAVTSMASLTTGAMTLISEQTASSSASVSFTTGIDSTYPIYKFEFINMHPASTGAFQVNFSADGGSNYNVTKTSAGFQSYHRENGTGGFLGYASSLDTAQSTGEQMIAGGSVVNDNDNGVSGEMYLYNPSSTTFVKHYMTIANSFDSSNPPYTQNQFSGGYCNTTSAINAVRFKFSSGNTDSGTIKLYGIKDS